MVLEVEHARLRRFCQRYWGGGQAELKLFKERTISFPDIGDDDDDGTCDFATLPYSDTSCTSLSPPSDLFGKGRPSILVRKEYPAVLNHLHATHLANRARGAVVTGQPGIGQFQAPFLSFPKKMG